MGAESTFGVNSNPPKRNRLTSRWLIGSTRHRYGPLTAAVQFLFNCDIKCPLPRATFLPHPVGIVIHAASRIDDDVTILHHVTLGTSPGKPGEAPRIERGVYLGAGAVVLGGVTVGEFAVIGANSVVTRDVPPRATVVGANRVLR